MRRPGVHGEAPLAPHARHVGAVEDGEREAEARFHLVAPLLQHRRRTRHHDPVHPPAQQQFTRDQPRLDRLAEADVVGDEQVDPRQTERLPQRFELVGVDADPGAKRRLEEVRIGGRDAVPRQRAQVGREQRRLVEALSGDGPPAVVLQDPGVQLVLPEHGQRLALGIVVEAGQVHEGRLALAVRLGDLLDEIAALADERDPARFGDGLAGGWRVPVRFGGRLARGTGTVPSWPGSVPSWQRRSPALYKGALETIGSRDTPGCRRARK